MSVKFSNRDVYVKESAIEGFGVFANRDFKKDEIVLDWKPEKVMSSKDMKIMQLSAKRFLSRVESQYVALSIPGKYVNHSCSPNTKVQNFNDIAVRDIRKDEEITADYFAERVPVKFVCKCGSVNCRGEYRG